MGVQTMMESTSYECLVAIGAYISTDRCTVGMVTAVCYCQCIGVIVCYRQLVTVVPGEVLSGYYCQCSTVALRRIK